MFIVEATFAVLGVPDLPLKAKFDAACMYCATSLTLTYGQPVRRPQVVDIPL